jgi:hypothetical protein
LTSRPSREGAGMVTTAGFRRKVDAAPTATLPSAGAALSGMSANRRGAGESHAGSASAHGAESQRASARGIASATAKPKAVEGSAA